MKLTEYTKQNLVSQANWQQYRHRWRGHKHRHNQSVKGLTEKRLRTLTMAFNMLKLMLVRSSCNYMYWPKAK